MFSYEGGLAVAFLLWLISIINVIISINSRQERNLKKIGQRLSWLTLTPKPMEADDLHRSSLFSIVKFLFIAAIGLPFILLSWLYVIMTIGIFVYKLMNDANAPQPVKEFRWKLRNIDMTFEQLVIEMMKVTEQDPSSLEKFRSDLVHELKGRGIKVG